MKIQLSNEEKLSFFHTALCNGLGYTQGNGIQLRYNQDDYDTAKTKLKSPCYEDVLTQILKDGNSLTFCDLESDEEDVKFDLSDVYSNMDKVEHQHLWDMYNEQDDALTADAIIQTVAFGEVIYG